MPLVDNDLEFLRTLVLQRSGNVISTNQGYLVESRLRPVAETFGLPNVEALVAELKKPAGRRLHDRIAEAMTINETSFFRDIHPFDALKETILPEVIENRAKQRQLTIWSAACSSGQEAYSIAMIIRENFPETAGWDIKIIATDLDEEMVKRTDEGIYSQFDVNRGLPAKLLIKYFDRDGALWQAKNELRKMVHARKLNFMDSFVGIPICDIVFLRNVLIYFDRPTKESILKRVHRLVSSDGYLFLGGGETLVNLSAPFERADVERAVVYHRTNPKGKKAHV